MAEKSWLQPFTDFPGLHKCLLKDSRKKCSKIYGQDQFLLVLIAATELVLAGELCMPLKNGNFMKRET